MAYTNDEKAEIVQMIANGVSIRAIQRKTGIAATTISNWLTNCQFCKDLIDGLVREKIKLNLTLDVNIHRLCSEALQRKLESNVLSDADTIKLLSIMSKSSDRLVNISIQDSLADIQRRLGE